LCILASSRIPSINLEATNSSILKWFCHIDVVREK
jgi:hypothetical protein